MHCSSWVQHRFAADTPIVVSIARTTARKSAPRPRGRAWLRRYRGVITGLVAVASALSVVFSLPSKIVNGLETVGLKSNPERAVQAAELTRMCRESHGMAKAQAAVWRKHRREYGDRTRDVRVFQRCSWPPSAGADADGYIEIRVSFAHGPNRAAEWPIGPYAYRIRSDRCDRYAVAFGLSGGTGTKSHPPAIEVAAGQIKTADGKRWRRRETGELPFFQERNEAIVLSNDHYTLDGIECSASGVS
jgi:hypothetical protein